MGAMPRVSIGHIGIYVTDYERMLDFYTRVFGFQVSDVAVREDGSKTAFTTNDPNAHHTLVLSAGRPADAPSTINQLSFHVETLDEVRRYWRAVKDEPGVSNVRCTSHGNAWSVYFLDPEGNRVEVYCDTPWHVPQPCGMTIDFEKSDAEIVAQTEAQVRALDGFEPFQDWRVKTARKLGYEDFRVTV